MHVSAREARVWGRRPYPHAEAAPSRGCDGDLGGDGGGPLRPAPDLGLRCPGLRLSNVAVRHGLDLQDEVFLVDELTVEEMREKGRRRVVGHRYLQMWPTLRDQAPR